MYNLEGTRENEGEEMREGDRMCPVCLNNYPKIGHELWCDWQPNTKIPYNKKGVIKNE